MSDFQVLTLLATVLGLVATAMNLVAFVREKDKSHTRAGLSFVFLLAVLVGVVLLPRYAPQSARQLVEAMPDSLGDRLQPWLNGPATRTAPNSVAAVESQPMLGSFTIEIQRNIFGGIGALVSNFQFSNSGPQVARVTAYHVSITPKVGDAPRNYDRVLSEPLLVQPGGTAKTQVELDAEIRDQWVAREGLEPTQRGPIEILWECQDQSGAAFQLSSSNG